MLVLEESAVDLGADRLGTHRVVGVTWLGP